MTFVASGTAPISLWLLLRDAHDIASSLLRDLNAIALATNVMVFLGRDTKPGLCINSLLQRRRLHLSAVKKSSGVLHRPRDPQAGAPGLP